MTAKTSLKATAGALALIAAAALATAACGREGSLERPGPMFGLPRSADDQPQDHGRTVPQSDRRSSDATRNTTGDANAAAGNTTADDDDNVPTTKRDLRDPAQRLTPLSASPIQGLSDPLGPPVSTKPPG